MRHGGQWTTKVDGARRGRRSEVLGWRMNDDDEMGLSSFTRAMAAPTFALRVMSLEEGESKEDAPERKRKKVASQRRCRQWLCTGELRAAAKTK